MTGLDEMMEREARTVRKLDAAAGLLLEALKLMPNDTRSSFDPARDVPEIEQALTRVRVVSASAKRELS